MDNTGRLPDSVYSCYERLISNLDKHQTHVFWQASCIERMMDRFVLLSEYASTTDSMELKELVIALADSFEEYGEVLTSLRNDRVEQSEAMKEMTTILLAYDNGEI